MIGNSNGRSILGSKGRSRDRSASDAGRQSNGDRVRFPDDTKAEDGSLLSSLWNILVIIVTSVLAANCVAGFMTVLVVLQVTVRPFSKTTYRRLVAQLGSSSFIDALALLLPNTKIYLTGDSDVPSQIGTSLMVSNHVIDADWWGLLMLGRFVGLRGTQKIFLRNEYLRIDMSHVEKSTHALVSTASLVASPRAVSSTTRGEASADSGSPGSTSSSSSGTSKRFASHDISLVGKLLHQFLEFPLMNGDDHLSDREHLFQLLRSFAEGQGSATPVHLLLYPEGWSLHHGADRLSIHAKSNEFAKREDRPQLKHLLLPRNRGFKATLECLRESNPVVYDVTMAYNGYDGSLPPSINLSLFSIWRGLLCDYPKEIHLRIKKYSMEEVLQDSSWLDKKWAEKDRLLSQFATKQCFPSENRGRHRSRVFETRYHSMENSSVALVRLLLLPCAVPVLILLSVPLFWTLLAIWLSQQAYRLLYPDPDAPSANRDGRNSTEADQTPGTMSANSGTPFCPTTPFVSPSVTAWLPGAGGGGQ